MKILTITVTRNRKELLEKTLDLLHLATSNRVEYQHVVGVDHDDPEEYVKAVRIPAEHCGCLASRWEYVYQQAKGLDYDYLLCLPDDVWCMTAGWDQALPDPNRRPYVIAYPFDGFNFECTIPIISRAVMQIVPFLCLPGLRHWYVDTWWGALGRQAECLHAMPDVLFLHLAPHNPLTKAIAPDDEQFARQFAPGDIQHDEGMYKSAATCSMLMQYARQIKYEASIRAKDLWSGRIDRIVKGKG